MRVRDVMRKHVIVAKPEDTLSTAAQMMLWAGGRHLPVVDDGDVVGVLSERDVLRFRAGMPEGSPLGHKVREAMSRPAMIARPTESLQRAAARMAEFRVGCLPVVEDGALVGIVSSTDVLHAYERDARLREEEAHASE